jgi:hypothetical protein
MIVPPISPMVYLRAFALVFAAGYATALWTLRRADQPPAKS